MKNNYNIYRLFPHHCSNKVSNHKLGKFSYPSYVNHIFPLDINILLLFSLIPINKNYVKKYIYIYIYIYIYFLNKDRIKKRKKSKFTKISCNFHIKLLLILSKV